MCAIQKAEPARQIEFAFSYVRCHAFRLHWKPHKIYSNEKVSVSSCSTVDRSARIGSCGFFFIWKHFGWNNTRANEYIKKQKYNLLILSSEQCKQISNVLFKCIKYTFTVLINFWYRRNIKITPKTRKKHRWVLNRNQKCFSFQTDSICKRLRISSFEIYFD